MSQTLTISDNLYAKLESAARLRGVNSVEELIRQFVEVLQSRFEEPYRPQDTVRRIDVLRERLFAIYGEMKDSVELIRADRAR